jgi:CRISPR system Cascade subunit CasA
MNLLIDKWIPIRVGTDFRQISYKELLCKEQSGLQVALPRDDLELACIQMLSAMSQVIFMPKDKKELRERIKTPLSEKEYDEGIKQYNEKDKEWFDLDHKNWPFMQKRGVKGEWTSIQKLMIGLPEITSKSPNAHAFFNESNEIRVVSAGVAAIALFNQAANSPSFGGGFKGSLRGAAPVSTMVMGSTLRVTIWMNVLSEDKVIQLLPWYNDTKRNDKPVWIEPIEGGDVHPHSIGLLRGLFWQPAHIELSNKHEQVPCDVIGISDQKCYLGFTKERFNYDLKGLWPHPYSPRKFNKDGDVKYISFKGSEPIWTQMNQYLFTDKNDKKEGFMAAPVISNHIESELSLLIGGYKASKATIEYRRHELYSLPAGWNDEFRGRITEVIEIGLKANDILINKVLYPVKKGNKDKGIKGIDVPINSKASSMYFHITEPIIHSMLHETSLKEYGKAKEKFLVNISEICLDIFNNVTQPFVHRPEFIGAIAIGRNKLNKLMNKLKKDHCSTGGAV